MVSSSLQYVEKKTGLSYFQRLLATLFVLATLVFTNKALALSQVTATVDKNPAMINESILLTVVADDDVGRSALDTSPLLSDFIVGQTSVSSQTSMVNFKTTRSTKWQVILIARNSGDFTIPALTINNVSSEPIALTVVEASATNDAIQADIFITSELSSNTVYVQQLLTLSLKLHFSVELKSGNLTEPSFTGAAIEKIGQDKQSESIINGKRYRVIEQTYAITPEQSGDFILPAALFSGEVLQASKRRSSFLSFAQTKPVSILGEELNLTVLPIPSNYPSNSQWLPTEILTLHQEWQSGAGEFVVGEPITRTITLTAAGLSKAQLPKLDMKNSAGLKVYPDQAELHANLSSERLVSQKVQNFAIVPSHAGDFVLPAMEVTWFNTITNKIEQASLPAQTITVKAAQGEVSTPTTAEQESQANKELNNQVQALPEQNNSSQATVADTRLLWLIACLWLLTIIAWFLHVRFLKQSYSGNKQKNKAAPDNGNHYLALLAACKKNDAEQALSLILPWLRHLLRQSNPNTQVNNLAQAQDMLNDQNLATALNDLQQHLYGKSAVIGAPSWQGMTLLSAIQQVNKLNSVKNNTTQTMSLNPSH